MSDSRTAVERLEIETVELERLVAARTHRRVRELRVDRNEDGLVLRGQTNSYHVKQLAQHGILDVMPDVRLINAIEVWN